MGNCPETVIDPGSVIPETSEHFNRLFKRHQVHARPPQSEQCRIL